MGGITGENLLRILECRLDNVVYRLGIAPTRAAARQLVSHRHITVNGAVVNIPSYQLRSGDVVGRSREIEVAGGDPGVPGRRRSRYSWLEWEGSQMSGKFLQKPTGPIFPKISKSSLSSSCILSNH